MSFLKKLFGTRKRRLRVEAQRYDSARPSERFHWKHVDSKSVDASLDPETRRIQRERARYEIANNSWAYGAAMTLANAVVGNGPRLQLISRDEFDAERVEWDFAEWSEEVRLGEKLRAMRFARFQDGESFAVLFDNKRRDGVRLDLAPIDAERVCAALDSLDANDVDGIKLDEWGAPVSYRVLTQHPGGELGFVEDATIYPAANVLHWYRRALPEQHRGCSEISPALNLFAYLERYTRAVVTAAETAADLAMVFYSDGADEGYEEEPTENGEKPFAEIPFTRGLTIAAPYGMKPAQIKAEQPTSTYSMLVDELLGEIGASIGLPRLLMKHCAAGYNYASGRLDFQEYYRFIRLNQKSCEISVLLPLFRAWLKEWELVNGEQLPKVFPQWYWDGAEHVDPAKEANAQATRLAALTTNLAIEYGKQGRDWEDELNQIAKERDKMKELGLSMLNNQSSNGEEE